MFRHWCAIMVLQACLSSVAASAESQPRLPALPNDEAWHRLPDAPAMAQPLPTWARALAKSMPVTTARMLEVDALHRTGDRLDARLRGLVRWAAADANKCGYSKSVALADLKRAGFPESIKDVASKNPERLSALDRLCMAFARKMAREPRSVSDAEFKEMLEVAGEERVVAVVALLAHANFQDHIFLALNLPAEAADAVVPPVTTRFGRPKPPPPGKHPAHPEASLSSERHSASPEWLRLQEGLDKQRARAGRIRVPSRDEVIARLGGESHPSAWQSSILWSRVCYGYQPEVTDAFFDCVAAFRTESSLDRIAGESIFWVVTESLQCFY